MRKFIVLFLVMGLVLSGFAANAFAQQPRNIHTLLVNGSEMYADINNGSGFNYMVRPTSSGTLIVQTSGSTDTFMIAYDSNYREIARDDDGGSGANARISLSVNANQNYYFNVTGYSEHTSGSFSIAATMPSSGSSSRTNNLELNLVYTGYIQAGEIQEFRVYLGNDPFFEICWDDWDRQHFGDLSDAADIRVGIRRENSSTYIVPISDVGNYTDNFGSYSNQHRIWAPGSQNSPRFEPNNWYIIEVDATYSGGNFRLQIW